MAVDTHPSRRPSPPRKPPATSTTDGQPNTVSKTMTGSGMMEYGSRNGKDLRVTAGHGTTRAGDFKDATFSERPAMKAGKEDMQEPKMTKAKKPGDERGSGEPG
jgi:hypothetical protein